MPLDAQLDALARIYRVLDDTFDNSTLACHRGCAACCTQNVTMTTLEGYRIITRLSQQANLREQLSAAADSSRFLPELTINDLARQCAENGPVSEKNYPDDPAPCPLLADNICTVYPVRPLACRTMISTIDCRKSGYAQMDSYFLSAGNIFLQFTEHIDQKGLTGNLTDVLSYVCDNRKRHHYEAGAAIADVGGLLPNHPLTVLMVPPEHRQQVSPILNQLNPAIGKIG
ncbi:MAG: hypothetical protein DSY89_02645 [Deltaproteobacteria bacterium]|nr:MAG: hypothetical protein DSY89_02645 [Deltaproteobacteria bacterium]